MRGQQRRKSNNTLRSIAIAHPHFLPAIICRVQIRGQNLGCSWIVNIERCGTEGALAACQINDALFGLQAYSIAT